MPNEDIDARDSDFEISKSNAKVRFQPNHSLMARPRPREHDMRPQRIFFYKRLTDDATLYFTEQEASVMMISSHAPVLRQIGVSDGTAYAAFIRESGLKPGQVVSIEEAQKVLDGALAAEVESARGHYSEPFPQNVHFDSTIRNHPNGRGIIEGFAG